MFILWRKKEGSRPRLQGAAIAALLFFCFLRAVDASAATTAGTAIQHTKAAATSDSFTGALESNQPADTIVGKIFGFAANPFTETGPVQMLLNTSGEATSNISITNNGNTNDQVVVIISALDDKGLYPLVSWSVEVDDPSPLIVQTSKTTAARATSSVVLPPGGTAQFAVKVTGTGAQYGATMSFNITLQTKGDAVYPSGAYTSEFNGANYAGPAAVTSKARVPTKKPSLLISSPANGSGTSNPTVDVTGITEAGANCTITVTGPDQGQQATYSFQVPAGGLINKTVGLYEGTTSGVNQISVNVTDWNGNQPDTPTSITVTRDSTAPSLALQLSNELVGPQIQIMGSAYDTQNHMAGYSVYYTNGAYQQGTTAIWKLIGSGTSNVGSAGSSGVLTVWDASNLAGTYTLKVVAQDISPYGKTAEIYQTVTLANLIELSGTIPSNRWTMIALPGIPKNADPRSFLGSGRYEVQYWDPRAADDKDLLKYKTTNIALTSAGQGFWVKPYGSSISYSIKDARVPDTSTVVTLRLYNGWNQIGSPYMARGSYTGKYIWNQVQVRINAGTPSEQTKYMADAIAAGWVDSQFFSYDSSRNGYMPFTTSDEIIPYTGYFVKANRDCDFIFNPGAGISGGVARIITPRYEWKLQLAAESGELHDDSNYAVMSPGADETQDSIDASEPPPVKPYVSLYFENTDSGRNTARLALDARAPIQTHQSKTWTFVVQTSDPGAVTVSVPNADKLPDNYRFRIRDEATGAEFDPKQQQAYQFADSRTSRRFTLSSQKVSDQPVETISHRFQRGWALISVPLEPEPTDVRTQLGDDISNIQVFQYYDHELYDPSSEKRVDLQAGVGYWIYLDADTVLDFSGLRPDPSAPVEVPLAKGWNIIGNPYENVDLISGNMRITNAGETFTLEEAVDGGFISPELYEYDSTTGAYEKHAIGVPLSPWKGYLIKTLKPCTLSIGPTTP